MKERTQIPVTPLSIPSKETNPSVRQFVSTRSFGFTQSPETIFDAKTVAHPIIETPLPRKFSEDVLTTRLATPSKSRSLLRWEVLLIIAILLTAALAHGINMFHFPYFENDEGTYMSQAWTVVNEGQLAPYTYWYDHTPGGWIQIAAWTIVTGGFHTFGFINNSGRVLMLLFQVASTLMLYLIARKSSGSIAAATIAALLFALSAYGIYFHRRVLLDNITTFWMLLSILLLLPNRFSLKRAWLSALALGISILSKELTIFLIPALTYLVFFRSDRSHRWFAIVGWLIIVMSLVSLYPLMAILKNELFPTGTFLGGMSPHVSLLGTLQYQASRGKDGGLFDIHSAIWGYLQIWAQDDPMLVIGGSLCAIVLVIIMRWNRLGGIMGLLTLSLYIFLGRGGEVIGFYLVPLLPLFALNIGLIFGAGADKIKKFMCKFLGANKALSTIIPLATVAFCVGSGLFMSYTNPQLYPGFQAAQLWNGTQSDAQSQATEWVKDHISSNSVIIIDDYMWTDLRDTGNASLAFKKIYWYWKVDLDPAISKNVFHNDWRHADYIVVTPQMLHDVKESNLKLMNEILMHSKVIKYFGNQDGWPIEIRQVNK